MKNILDHYFNDPTIHVIKASYNDIKSSVLEMGFNSEIIDNKDFHKLTRDIVLSVQKFEDNKLTNLVFSNNQAFRLELSDIEIIPYYSDYIEIRYIVSGSLVLNIENQILSFSEGDVCLIHSKAYHHEIISDSNCIIMNICIRRELIDELYLSNVSSELLQQFLRTNTFKVGKKDNFVRFIPRDNAQDDIKQYLVMLFFEVQKQKIGYEDISKGYILRLLDTLAKIYNYQTSEDDNQIYYQTLFNSVSKYMQENLSSVTMQDLSSEFHHHPNYFNRLIKQFSGLTYSSYLIQLRMNRAKELLINTDFPIDEIAWLVGYNNKGFFYKCLMNDVGMSPSQFRKKYKKTE